MIEHDYVVDVEWKADRKGMLSGPGLSDTFEVATPPQFPKGMEGIWSPEHLFTAAISSCLMTTFLAIAENSKLVFTSFSCKSKGKLDTVDGQLIMSEIILEPTVTIPHEQDRERAGRVLQKSEAACLISKSVKSKITMLPTIIIG